MTSIFDSIFGDEMTVANFLTVIGVTLLIGIFLAALYSFRTKHSRSFLVTMVILPAVVSVVIMMVNGNIGVGVAVAGAFSLVRFRSAPGTSKEIGTIFLAMCAGLIAGMGYIAYSVLFAIILGIVLLVCNVLTSKDEEKESLTKRLTITIPESLNYTAVFDDIFKKYCSDVKMVSTKTTNLGSMFKLSYEVTLRNAEKEKDFIDEIRCRNGNLEVLMCALKEEQYAL